ncbi:hypothetical protein [uncultured Fibrella sp.]|uniref:hypothetical protein n=1 Tax=uncultured Fibrella sp. TaxID=1284596 RepID=UPI0035CBB754
MKQILILILLVCSLAAQAQKPLSATLTNPKNLTLQVPKNPKIPPLNLPCKMANGLDRPFACEFRFDRLDFIGNDGKLLGSVVPKKVTLTLPFGKAKKTPPAGQDGPITYAVKGYFTRINKATFPVNKGYLIQSCPGPQCFDAQFTDISTLVTGLQIPATVGKQTMVPFDLTFAYRKGKEDELVVGVYLQNDVTTNSIKPKPGTVVAMHDKAEASTLLAPIVKKP